MNFSFFNFFFLFVFFRSKHLIREALGENDFLKNLSPSQMREIIDAMQLKKVASGAYVIREGDSGSHLYVSSQGEYEVIKVTFIY